jgi:SAM-dependent methyltransferase
MGLSCGAVEIIIQEHLYRPLEGKVLLIGRQNTDIPPKAMINLLKLYGLSPRVPLVIEKPGSLEHDVRTLKRETQRIADISVFHALADCQVMALDVSDYEGAEVIHDMNTPVPDSLKDQFDFIFDGSCMDNIFDGPQVLRNMSAMLRPGGRMVLYNASNSARTGYLQYSPDWFIDFFAINNYADCKIYVHEFLEGHEDVPGTGPASGLPPQNGAFWHFDPLVVYHGQKGYQNSEISDEGHRYVYVVAEKAEDSTSTAAPCQMHYRGKYTRTYIDSAVRFRLSPRPIVRPRSGEPFSAPSISLWDIIYPLSRWTRRSYPPREPSPYVNQAPLGCPPDIILAATHGPETLVTSPTNEHGNAGAAEAEIIVKLHRVEEEKEARIRERDAALTERDELREQLHRIEKEKEARLHERDAALQERDEVRAQLRRLEEEKEARIRERDAAMQERDKTHAQLRHLEEEKEARIHERDKAYDHIKALTESRSWRLTAPLRSVLGRNQDTPNTR